MNLKIQLVKTKEEYDDILEIRKQVFVREQNVPESIEIEYESVSSHVICFLNGDPVGTGRWRKSDSGLGIGKEIVNFILSQISSNKTIYLHAQEAVVDFYKKLGFSVSGKQFFEANIPHSKMIYKS
jgi:predicted GNAT family N-acyltransferase